MIDLRKYYFVIDDYQSDFPNLAFETENEAQAVAKNIKDCFVADFDRVNALVDKNAYIQYGLNP